MINTVSILEEISFDTYNKEIAHLIEKNIFELTIPELKYIGTMTEIDEAKRMIYLFRSQKMAKINNIVENCHNEVNLVELKKAISFNQKNIFVLELIATSNTPYEIRKGFECGSRLTKENLYGTGFPAFSYLFAENSEVILPHYVMIITADKVLVPYSVFKHSIKTKRKSIQNTI